MAGLILQDVAARLAGRPAASLREDPVAWAYALRDAIAIAEPDVVVSHWDPSLEADALREAVAGADDPVDGVLDAPALAGLAPVSAAVELVRTLAGLYPAVAVPVTAPAEIAALLGGDEELADVVEDALAGLVGAYAEAGARIVVLSSDDAGPLTRAVAHHRLETLPASAVELIPGDVALEELRSAARTSP